MEFINNLHPFIKYCLICNTFHGLTHRLSGIDYSTFLSAVEQGLITISVCPYGDMWSLKNNINNPYLFLYWAKQNTHEKYVNYMPDYLVNSYNLSKQLKFISNNISILGETWELTYWGKMNIVYHIDNPNIIQKLLYNILKLFY